MAITTITATIIPAIIPPLLFVYSGMSEMSGFSSGSVTWEEHLFPPTLKSPSKTDSGNAFSYSQPGGNQTHYKLTQFENPFGAIYFNPRGASNYVNFRFNPNAFSYMLST